VNICDIVAVDGIHRVQQEKTVTQLQHSRVRVDRPHRGALRQCQDMGRVGRYISRKNKKPFLRDELSGI